MASHDSRGRRLAYQLSQLGQLASTRFVSRTRELGLSASDAGVLRLIGRTPQLSQRVLAGRLGVGPSRLVAIVDSLEERDLVARTRSTTDRRNYELSLTDAGTAMLVQLRTVAEEHEREITQGLNAEERADLARLLDRLAEERGLDADAHAGLGRPGPSERG